MEPRLFQNGACVPNDVTFSQAQATCDAIGARLCTFSEYASGEVRGTGVSLVWLALNCAILFTEMAGNVCSATMTTSEPGHQHRVDVVVKTSTCRTSSMAMTAHA
jgi:hypothetical protein